MIDDSLMEYLLKRAMSDGGDFADIYAEQRRGTIVQFEAGRIEKAVSGSVSGIGIRLVSDKKTAYAYSNDFSRETLERIADTVRISLSKATASGTSQIAVFNMKRRYPEIRSIIVLALKCNGEADQLFSSA